MIKFIDKLTDNYNIKCKYFSWEEKKMKKLITVIGLLITMISSSFAFTWAEYEIRCYFNGKEPSFEEYEYLCTIGATDYSEDKIVKFIESAEKESDK